ncbi:MAG: hypothetical protein GKR92_05445 [Gammaproteobacteria bacterium]|nr:MAG: hypothetical protein GKR92_05445 [Gammaproteobacteria bacterium]
MSKFNILVKNETFTCRLEGADELAMLKVTHPEFGSVGPTQLGGSRKEELSRLLAMELITKYRK